MPLTGQRRALFALRKSGLMRLRKPVQDNTSLPLCPRLTVPADQPTPPPPTPAPPSRPPSRLIKVKFFPSALAPFLSLENTLLRVVDIHRSNPGISFRRGSLKSTPECFKSDPEAFGGWWGGRYLTLGYPQQPPTPQRFLPRSKNKNPAVRCRSEAARR